MKYCFNNEQYRKIFAVPECVVKEYLRLAGAAQLKVLLWLLCNNNDSFVSEEELSKALGIPKGDVCDAMQYWLENGLVKNDKDEPAAEKDEAEKEDVHEIISAEKEPTELSVAPVAVRSARTVSKLSRGEALSRAKSSPELSWLVKEAQNKFGRPLSSAEMTDLVSINVNDGLPCPIILMIIEYAAANDRCNIRYIDSTAAQWMNNDIDTVEKAEAFLKRIEQLGGYWRKVQSAFSLEYRRPSQREQIFAERWVGQWHFSQKMLRKAYDICIDSTGKLNMNYINKILDSWQSSGIATPEQADSADTQRHAKKRSQNGADKEGSFSANELYGLFLQPSDDNQD